MTDHQRSSSLSGNGQTVVVTGAGGFIASWIVKLLLERGYYVRGTVRNPDDPKNIHLRELEGARERLSLRKADIFNFESLKDAFAGCNGVFHTAHPMTNDKEMVVPAVNGTKNVIVAACEAKVKRIVLTSSVGAVHMNPACRDPDALVDESCWSDLEFCKNTENWYCYGKTVAEQVAWDETKERGMDLVVVIPGLVFGPLLQTAINHSIVHILKYLDGSAKYYANSVHFSVHVMDVALAHILVYESVSASGRYLCCESSLHRGDVVKILSEYFPEYPIPIKMKDDGETQSKTIQVLKPEVTRPGFEIHPSEAELV